MADTTEPAHEELPPVIREQMARLRAAPGRWHRVLGFRDRGALNEVARRLGAHPECKGFAWATRQHALVLCGAYLGTEHEGGAE